MDDTPRLQRKSGINHNWYLCFCVLIHINPAESLGLKCAHQRSDVAQGSPSWTATRWRGDRTACPRWTCTPHWCTASHLGRHRRPGLLLREESGLGYDAHRSYSGSTIGSSALFYHHREFPMSRWARLEDPRCHLSRAKARVQGRWTACCLVKADLGDPQEDSQKTLPLVERHTIWNDEAVGVIVYCLLIISLARTAFYVQKVLVDRSVLLTWPGVSPLPVEGRLLLVKAFLGSCGLVSILTSGVLMHVSWASFSSGGISSQYLHQGGGQQLEVKIISSRRQSDTLRHTTVGWNERCKALIL